MKTMEKRMKQIVSVCLLALAWSGFDVNVSVADAGENDWPQFRGPTGNGLSPAKGIPTTWSTNQNVLWKANLPKFLERDGRGNVTRKQIEEQPNAYNPWSSPIVSKGKVFVASSGVKVGEHKLLCFNLADGSPLWETPIPPGPIRNRGMIDLLANIDWVRVKDGAPAKDTHISVGYDICTPCTDGERVYVTFGSYALTAVDLNGTIVWQKPLAKPTDKTPASGHYAKETDTTLGICLGPSPIVYSNLVIQISASSMKAFDGKTGDLKYEISDPGFSRDPWSTPILVSNNQETVLLYHGYKGLLQCFDPDNGSTVGNGTPKLWNYGQTPVYDAGIVYGMHGGAGCALFAISTDFTSTEKPFKGDPATLKMPAFTHGSPVVVDGMVYAYVNDYNQGAPPTKKQPDRGCLTCVNLTTGTLAIATNIPLPGASNWTSPVATADGYVYVATGGRSYVVKTGPKLEVFGPNDLDDYNIGPSPAVTDGKLIIRGANKLWCIGRQ